jgi:hypothetical protein
MAILLIGIAVRISGNRTAGGDLLILGALVLVVVLRLGGLRRR